MMQAMRDRVKLIYWIVILTFVGLMFLVWGVGFDNKGQGGGNPGVIAEVNGVEISVDQWRDRTNSIVTQMRQRQNNDQPLNENQVLRAREQAYDELISETLQQAEASKLGLSVSDEEIADILANDPPMFLLGQFRDADGNIDYDAYYRALSNPNNNWRQVEEFLRYSLPLQKLEQRISGRALVSETEMREAFAEQSVRAVAEYVGLAFTDVELEDETVSDEEALAWYESHREDYEQPERARVRLVTLPKVASHADEEEILSILQEIRQDIVDGTLGFDDAARTYSEDTSGSEGGDLGFFDRERMVAPFTEAAFALAVGEVSQPVKTQFGYHLIKVVDERLADDGTRQEIRARHVLLKLHPSQETVEELRTRVNDAREQAASRGLEAAASDYGLEITEPDPFNEGFNLPGVANSLAGSAFAFENEVGALSPVYETEDALYFVEVAERLPAGARPLEDVRALVDSAVLQERRATLARERLATAWARIAGGESFEGAAADAGLSHAITDTFTLRQNIEGIGFATSFARAAMELSPGQSLSEVETQRGVYALKLLYKSEVDEEEFRARRAQIGSSLLYNRRRQLLQNWLEKLKDEAEIVDRRADFL